ncbi:MAG: hypothetical protein Kow00121_64340 [Elainellaceae cyanobacterium]
MLRTSLPFQLKNSDRPNISDQICLALKKFWEFSNFYGEYNSLPPHERGRFVSTIQKANKKTWN